MRSSSLAEEPAAGSGSDSFRVPMSSGRAVILLLLLPFVPVKNHHTGRVGRHLTGQFVWSSLALCPALLGVRPGLVLTLGQVYS